MSMTYRFTFAITCFLISLFIHCLFFETFNIKISHISDSFKPTIIFLGPILGNREFTSYGNTAHTPLTTETKVNISVNKYNLQGPAQEIFTDLPDKKIFTTNTRINNKENVKSTFPEHIPQRFQADTNKEDAQINQSHYKPLSLDNL